MAAAVYWCRQAVRASVSQHERGMFTDFPVYEQAVSALSALSHGACTIGWQQLHLQSVQFATGSCLFVTARL